MILKNRFSEEDKIRAWADHQYCAICGLNQNCSLHHILGTKSDSILNSIMLCYEHHKEADGHNVSDIEYQSKLLKYAMVIIIKSGYELTEKDILFYKEHSLYYN